MCSILLAASVILSIYVMYLLSKCVSCCKHAHRTVITLARLKIVPTIKKLIVDVFFMIVRCGAVENYMFLSDGLQFLHCLLFPVCCISLAQLLTKCISYAF